MLKIDPIPLKEPKFENGWKKWLRGLRDVLGSLDIDVDTTTGGNRWRGGVDTTEDIIIDDSDYGLVLVSPDGHYWRVQVDNTGTLTTTDLGTTKP